MFERFTRDARAVVTSAGDEAVRRGDDHVGTEHLLLGICVTRPDLASLIGTTTEGLRGAMDSLDRAALDAAGVSLESGRLRHGWNLKVGHRPFTTGAKEVLKDCLRETIDLGSRRIECEHILLAIAIRPARDPALRVLEVLGCSSDSFRDEIRRNLRRSA